jgi:hypothetical protein
MEMRKIKKDVRRLKDEEFKGQWTLKQMTGTLEVC